MTAVQELVEKSQQIIDVLPDAVDKAQVKDIVSTITTLLGNAYSDLAKQFNAATLILATIHEDYPGIVEATVDKIKTINDNGDNKDKGI